MNESGHDWLQLHDKFPDLWTCSRCGLLTKSKISPFPERLVWNDETNSFDLTCEESITKQILDD